MWFMQFSTGTLTDIASAFKRISLVGALGWQDVRQRYRRSALGPFWLTISMGIMIGTIGLVFGKLFNSPMVEFLPFLAAGIILWTFISSVVTEGCSEFVSAQGIIKQLPIPLFVHTLRMIWRNCIILFHNIIIFPVVLLVLGGSFNANVIFVVPGFLLLLVNLAWLGLMLGVVCARYRDLPQIVSSALQVLFYLTPIIWMPKLLPERAGSFILDFNPVFHLIEVVRSPLLGQVPSFDNWLVSTFLAVSGWVVAIFFYGRYRKRLPYWL
ncbi:ABC transporter permease [Microbulbifer harenosus]|uniref:Transport permease protein n=2 Tax=Microbulbifer harenosus TaxID=2576840 RepID=A0ABY2UKK8_9GAMM|nr:ABC transporter permease [Microbulbifer harenosus]